MSDQSVWNIAFAILASLGGGGLVVGALVKWLGDVIAQRISRDEQNTLNERLEDLKQELGLARISYERHAQHVVDYYAMFYKSYQLAQQTEHADLIRRPDQEDLDPKKNYLAKIDGIADEWNTRHGLLRLILPKEALTLHQRAIGDLNTFKDLVADFDHGSPESRAALHDAFVKIDATKQELEGCLRSHLRVDKV